MHSLASDSVESLSAKQVTLLLRTLQRHRDLLQSSHEDARRRAQRDQKPAYVVDFDLIWKFIHPTEASADVAVELGYLFSHLDTTFVIGPGTRLEIDRHLASMGFHQQPDGEVKHVRPRWLRSLGTAGEEQVHRTVTRLEMLIEAPNVVSFHDFSTAASFDDRAYELALATLRSSRPQASDEANEADALNWAAVVATRRHKGTIDDRIYPYLLTGTRPLLDERLWTPDIHSPVSRDSSEALYTEVLFDVYDDAAEAQERTVEMALEAARLEFELRNTPAYRDPEGFEGDADWEQIIDERRVAPSLREQLQSLTSFVDDPVVAETQRIYDNARLTAASSLQQSRALDDPGQPQTPQQLFDLIRGINAALNAARPGGPTLADLWQSFLTVEITQHGGKLTTYALVSRHTAGPTREYLVVDIQDADGSDADRLCVVRWPSSLDGDVIADVFSGVFRRAGLQSVDLMVGSSSGVSAYDADIPFELSEILAAHSQSESGSGQDSETVMWIRANATPLDLYADLRARLPRPPVVGVFSSQFSSDLVAELVGQTSARYLFGSWLKEGLLHIARAIGDEQDSTNGSPT